MSLRHLCAILALLLPAAPAAVRAEEFVPDPGFISLLNGKDLTGWRYQPDEKFDGKTEASDGRYTAKDGMISRQRLRCRQRPAPPPALDTTREFPRNFILKLEFRAAANADSGIFIRKPQAPVPRLSRRRSLQRTEKLQAPGLEPDRSHREGRHRPLHLQRRGPRSRPQAPRHRPHRSRSRPRPDGIPPPPAQSPALTGAISTDRYDEAWVWN